MAQIFKAGDIGRPEHLMRLKHFGLAVIEAGGIQSHRRHVSFAGQKPGRRFAESRKMQVGGFTGVDRAAEIDGRGT